MKDEPCPYCGTPTEADEVDNGVGMQQVGPRGCPACHAVEIRFPDEPQNDEERRTGYRR